MSGKSLIDQIKHYQKDIERCPDNTERMIRCIQRLYVLPVKVEHLQETGVGRSVNSLRKYKGDVGNAAKLLVSKWKAMVAEDDSSDEAYEVSTVKKSEMKLASPPPPPVPPPTMKIDSKNEQHISKDKKGQDNHRDSRKHQDEKRLHHSKAKSHSADSKSYNSDKNKSYKSESKSHNSESKSHDSGVKSHSTDMKSHHFETKSHSSNSKSRDKSSDTKSSSSSKKVRDSSLSPKNNHSAERKLCHKNYKSNHVKKRKADSDDSSPNKKIKDHHSKSHSCRKRKEISRSETEDESSSSASSESYASAASEVSGNSHSENELVHANDNSNSGNESTSSSSDEEYKSKHKSLHPKKDHFSFSNERDRNRHKEKIKEKEKNNETSSRNGKYSKNDKHGGKKSRSSDYSDLIKENEKVIKKEKEFVVPKKLAHKPIKLEPNEDGSIDSGSGASFADALLGMDSLADTKKKKKFSDNCSSNDKHSSKTSKKSSKSHHSGSSGSKSDTHHSKSLRPSTSPSSSASSSPCKARSLDELVEPPELLSKKVKLEALDLDISSNLPEINLNYKPLPHVPEPTRRPLKTMTEEAMFDLMTSKNQRTKVYSGNKVYSGTVPTLFSLCIQLLYENIESVEYTGGIPYGILKPLLERLNADQLFVLEHFNPYLIEETDELWQFHCKKDFRGESRQDMETWRELYVRCIEERERKLKALTANITESMAKSAPVRQVKLAYVDAVAKPPRNVARKQAKYGTGSSSSSTSNSTPSSSKNPSKQEIVSKAIVGGHTPGVSADEVVPPPRPAVRAANHHPTPSVLKKKKAPLMQKALQVMKGNRYKR